MSRITFKSARPTHRCHTTPSPRREGTRNGHDQMPYCDVDSLATAAHPKETFLSARTTTMAVNAGSSQPEVRWTLVAMATSTEHLLGGSAARKRFFDCSRDVRTRRASSGWPVFARRRPGVRMSRSLGLPRRGPADSARPFLRVAELSLRHPAVSRIGAASGARRTARAPRRMARCRHFPGRARQVVERARSSVCERQHLFIRRLRSLRIIVRQGGIPTGAGRPRSLDCASAID